MKQCGQCGADISHRPRHARYCEDYDCRRARARQAGAESWERCGEGQRAKRRAQYAAKVAARPTKTRLCAFCHEDISHRGHRALYCGWRCLRMAYHRAHPEVARAKIARARARDPERLRAISARWREQNRDRYLDQARKAQQKRRAQKAGSAPPGDISHRSWWRLLVQYGFACAYCRRRDRRLVQEHVVPLSRGGRHAEGNIVPACQPCNNRKCDKLLIEWRMGRRITRERRPATHLAV